MSGVLLVCSSARLLLSFWGVPREDAKVEKVRANWDEADLYKTMKWSAQH